MQVLYAHPTTDDKNNENNNHYNTNNSAINTISINTTTDSSSSSCCSSSSNKQFRSSRPSLYYLDGHLPLVTLRDDLPDGSTHCALKVLAAVVVAQHESRRHAVGNLQR